MTDHDDGTELRALLELTAEQHHIARRIDLIRARIDERARTQFATTGAAPVWKLPKLGQIRLDGIDPDPKPYVENEAELASWLAQRQPTEVTATIEVPADKLEAALEVLGFAEIPIDRSEVTPRPAGVGQLLKHATLVEDDDAPKNARRWFVVDEETGEVVPGLAGRLSSSPRLVVSVDKDRKAAAVDQADREDAEITAQAGEPAPVEEAS